MRSLDRFNFSTINCSVLRTTFKPAAICLFIPLILPSIAALSEICLFPSAALSFASSKIVKYFSSIACNSRSCSVKLFWKFCSAISSICAWYSRSNSKMFLSLSSSNFRASSALLFASSALLLALLFMLDSTLSTFLDTAPCFSNAWICFSIELSNWS